MLVSHLDNHYLEWGKMFLLSLKRNCPAQEVFLSTVNLNGQQVSDLKEINSNLRLSDNTVVIPEGQERQRFMQCRVSKVMLEAWNFGLDSKYIVSNADMLVRKPITPLYKLLDEFDILLHFTQEHMVRKTPHQIQNGIMAFKFNARVLDFILEYDRLLWQKGIVKAFDDQRVLFEVYQKFKSLSYGRIPDSYVDGDFRPSSHIWSGHSHGRFLNFQKFQKHLGLKVTPERPKDFV